MNIIKTVVAVTILLSFSGLLRGQEMTKEQKQIIEKIEQQNKRDEQKRSEIEKKLGYDKRRKPKSDYFWEEGVGLTTKNINQARDLGQYKQGGNADCRNWGSKDELSFECDLNKVRDFIWQNWTDKTRGYIRISTDSVDYQGTSHIFIEPDAKGKWQIVEITVRFQAVSQPNPYSVDKPNYYTSVNRINGKDKTNDWALLLRDESDKNVWKLPDFSN